MLVLGDGSGDGGCGEGVGWFVLVNGSDQEMDGASWSVGVVAGRGWLRVCRVDKLGDGCCSWLRERDGVEAEGEG
jgi:hypothetical protein